ncbi:MAG: YdcF family protein, partial [Cellulosilyticaceae bacterium]
MQAIDDITDFIFVRHELEAADILFIPGGSYPELGEQAALLWQQKMVPHILPSGKYSPSRGAFSGPASKPKIYTGKYETEWAFLREVLRVNGVSEEAILREDTAEYTYQNAFKSRAVTDQMGLSIKKAIICCKGFHARRCLMYYQWAYPETQLMICPFD